MFEAESEWVKALGERERGESISLEKERFFWYRGTPIQFYSFTLKFGLP